MLINILLIALICVIVTDLTDFFDFINRIVWNWIYNNKKPYTGKKFKLLSCSLCQTWWLSFIYLIATKDLHLYSIAYALLIAFLTPVIAEAVLFIKDILMKLIVTLENLIIK